MNILGGAISCPPHSIIIKRVNQIFFLPFLFPLPLPSYSHLGQNRNPIPQATCFFTLSSIALSLLILCSLATPLVVSRMPNLFPLRAFDYSFSSRILFPMYLHGSFLHFIHISAQKHFLRKAITDNYLSLSS